jgi:ribosomal protein S6--L-glutamate ligase
MKILMLSGQPKSYSCGRLREAARAKGHSVRVIPPSKFLLDISQDKPDLWYKNKQLPRPDAIIPRFAASNGFFGTAVVRQFEQMNIFCLNASHAISVAQDKLQTMQMLSRHEIPMPHSAFVFDKNDIRSALEMVGGAPVVIKFLQGTQGSGVMLAESEHAAVSILEALQVARVNVLIQKFVKESKGRDIRAFVVGDQVVASMRRIAQDGEFRSNVHLGGLAEAVTLDPAAQKVAVKAAQLLGLRVAGVDLLESDSGPQVMEINSSPGLEGIEGATNVNIAALIIEHLEQQIDFPDLDMRDLLSLAKGYAVVEVYVGKNSPHIGMTIKETHLSDEQIRVLSILRGTTSIPAPGGAEVIEKGDTLICYGSQPALKNLLPVKKK